MKGYCGSRWRRWWGQAEGGESKDSSSGVFCIDFETATSLSDGPDPVPAANNRHRAYVWIGIQPHESARCANLAGVAQHRGTSFVSTAHCAEYRVSVLLVWLCML